MVKLRKCGYRSNLCYFLFRLLILIGKFRFIWKKSPPKFNLYLKRVIRKKKLLLGDNIFFPNCQIYSAKMEIHAQLSGLRHIMWANLNIFFFKDVVCFFKRFLAKFCAQWKTFLICVGNPQAQKNTLWTLRKIQGRWLSSK